VIWTGFTFILSIILLGLSDNTTTREALELGKAVVKLPGRLIGGQLLVGRWLQASYRIMSGDDDDDDDDEDTLLGDHVVASNAAEEYVRKAVVALGCNESLRGEV